MSPRQKRGVEAEDEARLVIALVTYEQAEEELRAAVQASEASVRAIAEITGFSPSTIHRWRGAPDQGKS